MLSASLNKKHLFFILFISFQMFTIVYSKLCIFISALVELMMQLPTCSHDHYTEFLPTCVTAEQTFINAVSISVLCIKASLQYSVNYLVK